MKYPTNEKEMFKVLLNDFSNYLTGCGCNDFTVANTPENFALLEEMGADNLRCKSVEEFRNHQLYSDYSPLGSSDGKYLYTQDYAVLALLKKRLGL